jgi:DNA-binding CsgD family transcriptional regulator
METTDGHHWLMAAVAHRLDDEPLDPAEAEREAVTNLTAEGHSTREVGEILGVSNATVSRDVTNVTPLDAVAEMSAAAFAVIQRAHAICGHPPASEMPAEVGLDEERARAIFEELLPTTVGDGCLVEVVDDETDEVVTDWAQIAADAWAGESWAQAAKEYQVKRGKQRTIVDIEPEKLQRLRALLDDDVSLQRAYAEIAAHHIKGRAFRRRGCAQ